MIPESQVSSSHRSANTLEIARIDKRSQRVGSGNDGGGATTWKGIMAILRWG